MPGFLVASDPGLNYLIISVVAYDPASGELRESRRTKSEVLPR